MEQNGARKRKIVIVLLGVVVSVALLSFLITLRVPELKIVDVYYFRYSEDPPCVFVNETVVNSSPVTANNVTVVIQIYVQGVSPHGWRQVKTEIIDLGTISRNSAKDFEAYVTYQGIESYVFAGIRYDLLY